MENRPLVTIGAINYNNAAYVLETLGSIAAQTYDNTELIIVDDCSTDNSASLIEEWLRTYSKPYKFIKHEKNYGVCKTCNDTLLNASGKYFSYIATDDALMPEKISVQVAMLETSAENVCAVYSDAYLMNDDGSPHYGWFIQRYRNFATIPSGNIYKELFKGNWLPAMSLLIKRELLNEVGLFDEQLAFEDFDMWLRLSKKYEFIFSDYISARYRIRQNSLMSIIKTWHDSEIQILLKHPSNKTAHEKLDHLAFTLYQSKDKGKAVLKKYSSQWPLFKPALLLFEFHVPRFLGVKILKRQQDILNKKKQIPK